MSIKDDNIRQTNLADYVRQRNGVPLGASGSMRNMLMRSFGAVSFASFWRYWNPIFSYYLHKYIFSPLRHIAPRWLALVITFLFCGALHDSVTLIARGSTAFLFTTLFLFFALGQLLGELTRLDTAKRSWFVRAIVNLSYLATCIALAFYVRSAAPFWPELN